MHKLHIEASQTSLGEWSIKTEWYPAQTANFGWASVTLHMRYAQTQGNTNPWFRTRLIAMHVARWMEIGETAIMRRRKKR